MADAGDAEETEERRDKARKVVGEVGGVDEWLDGRWIVNFN